MLSNELLGWQLQVFSDILKMINLKRKLLDWIWIGNIIFIVIAKHVNTITVTVQKISTNRTESSVLSIIPIIQLYFKLITKYLHNRICSSVLNITIEDTEYIVAEKPKRDAVRLQKLDEFKRWI